MNLSPFIEKEALRRERLLSRPLTAGSVNVLRLLLLAEERGEKVNYRVAYTDDGLIEIYSASIDDFITLEPGEGWRMGNSEVSVAISFREVLSRYSLSL